MEFNTHLSSVVRTAGPARVSTLIGRRLHAGERHSLFRADIWQQFLSTLQQEDFIQYPNDAELVSQLAEHHNVNNKNIILFAGADAALDCIVRCFACNSAQVIVPEYHFPMYDVYAARVDAQLCLLKYEQSTLTTNPDVHINNARLAIIANPNSPVGDNPSKELFAFLESLSIPIVVDSVYCDFGSTQLDVKECLLKNYIFVHSFSKSFGGCGARIGYAIANDQIISLLNAVRPMNAITGPSIKFAQWAIKNLSMRDEYVAEIISIRNKIQQIYPWNIGGNWVHLPSTIKPKLNKLQLTYKDNCYLPGVIDEPFVRITVSPLLLALLELP